jgi:hypothetical protein
MCFRKEFASILKKHLWQNIYPLDPDSNGREKTEVRRQLRTLSREGRTLNDDLPVGNVKER